MNELDLLAAATDNLRAADKNLDLASKRLARARWLHYTAAIQLAVAITLYVLGAFDVYGRLC